MADIESFLLEKRVFEPDVAFANQANWGPKKVTELRRLAARSPERFWEQMAKEHVSWFKPWRKVLDWKPPFAKWFLGAQTNVSYNCIDRHVEGENAWRRNKAAIIWEGEPGEKRTLTGSSNMGQHVADCGGSRTDWHDALVLQEAALPIDPIPVVYGIERIEERPKMGGRLDALAQLLAVIEGIEDSQGDPVDQGKREFEWEVERSSRFI